ncbi:MAG: DUF2339 domain-containing protein [Hyphomicrobiales bacterium]
MTALIILAIIAFFLGPVAFILALVAQGKVSRLGSELGELRRSVAELARQRPPVEATSPDGAQASPGASDAAQAVRVDPQAVTSEPPPEIRGAASAPPAAQPASEPGPLVAAKDEALIPDGASRLPAEPARSSDAARAAPPPPPATPGPPRPSRGRDLEERLGAHWAVWAGGVAFALGAVLLVRYSIEQGFFGPGMRVVLGLMLAAALIAVGEFLRRKDVAAGNAAGEGVEASATPFATPYIPGVLTAAGTVAAFTSIYAAHALYGFIGPTLAFLALGATGLAAMAAAALHGPALAGLGLVGALATPLLVISTAPEPWPVIAYNAVVIACAYLLARLRRWLWLALAAAAGGALWALFFTARIAPPGAADLFHASLTQIAVQTALAAYVLVVDAHRGRADANAYLDPVAHGVLGVFTALALLALHAGAPLAFGPAWIAAAAILALLLGATGAWVAAACGAMGFASLVILAGLCLWPGASGHGSAQAVASTVEGSMPVAMLLSGVPPVQPFAFAAFAVLAALLVAGVAGWRLLEEKGLPRRVAGIYAAVASLTPLIALAIAYLRFSAPAASPASALVAAALGAAFVAASAIFLRAVVARYSEALKLGLGAMASSAVAAFALGLVFALDGGTLTVALALAALGTAFVAIRLDIAALRWCVAALGLFVAARLAYEPQSFDEHLGRTPIFNWLLFDYGVPAAAFAMAARLLRQRADDASSRVAEALAILFSALLFFFEIRHAMNGGDPLAPSSGLAEQGLLAVTSFGFSLVLTGLDASRSNIVFRFASYAAAVIGAVLAVLGLGLIDNPVFDDTPLAGGAILNTLMLGYLLPAVMAGILAIHARHVRPFWYWAGAGALCIALGPFAYASLEIRRLFQGPVLDWGNGFGQSELYTYSVAWLAIGILLLAYGVWRGSRAARLASACFVVAAALKVFLIDLAGLEGILRALSFIGLGLVLIGIGLVYQKLVFSRRATETQGG